MEVDETLVQPQVRMPIIKIPMYREDYKLCKAFCGDDTEKVTKNYIIKPKLNESKTINYVICDKNTGKNFIEFNEYGAWPSTFRDVKAHEKWGLAMRELKEEQNNIVGYFNDEVHD